MKPAATLHLAVLVCGGVRQIGHWHSALFSNGSVRATRAGTFKVLAHSRCKRQNSGAPKMSTP